MKTRLQQQQHEQLLEQLRAQGAIALTIPQLYQQEGEGKSPSSQSTEPSATEPSPAPSTDPSASSQTSEDLTGLKNSLAAARRERDEALRKLTGAQSELTTAQNTLTETQGNLGSLQTERDDLKIDLALSNELRDVDPSKRDLLWNTARSQVALSDGEVKAGDRPLTEFVSGLRSQYPDMFFAPNVPTGTGAAASTPQSAPAVSTVDAPGGIITGVNPGDIIAGKVRVNAT
ncbi:MAG: hypothetical protein WBA57_21415 [Elainellaceae cyanobacterium]